MQGGRFGLTTVTRIGIYMNVWH